MGRKSPAVAWRRTLPLTRHVYIGNTRQPRAGTFPGGFATTHARARRTRGAVDRGGSPSPRIGSNGAVSKGFNEEREIVVSEPERREPTGHEPAHEFHSHSMRDA